MYSYSFLLYAMNWGNILGQRVTGYLMHIIDSQQQGSVCLLKQNDILVKIQSIYFKLPLAHYWPLTVCQVVLPVICPLLRNLTHNKTGKCRVDWDTGPTLTVSVLVPSLILLLNWGILVAKWQHPQQDRQWFPWDRWHFFTLPYMWFPSPKLLTYIT